MTLWHFFGWFLNLWGETAVFIHKLFSWFLFLFIFVYIWEVHITFNILLFFPQVLWHLTSMCVCVCVFPYSGGKKYLIPCWFCTLAHWQSNDQSIILMVVYLNSERQNNNKKIQKNAFKKSYKLICILMSEIRIWPLRKTWLSTWWQNPCWQSQRSDVSCSWPPGLHTSQEGFCSTLPCRSSPSQ